MKKAQDLRVTKTYLALTNAFFQMMEDIRFEDITVNELCNRAMVRRATFYKHFADKYEFLTFVVRETQAKFDAETAKDIDSSQPIALYINIVYHVMDFLEKNRKLVQSAMKSSSFLMLLHILSEQITLDIRKKLKEDVNRGYKLIASPEVMAPFFTGALLETVLWWITQGKPIPEASVKEQISSLMAAMYQESRTESPNPTVTAV